jgi:hypothetical protein
VRLQWAFIVAVFVGATMAIPFLYNHRFDAGLFGASLLVFVAAPIVAAVPQGQLSWPVALFAIAALLLCPVVGAITDPLTIKFERLRDIFFLGTGSTLIFVTTIWFRSSYGARKWLQAVAAALSLETAVLATASDWLWSCTLNDRPSSA